MENSISMAIAMSSLISLLISYFIISFATKAEKRLKIETAQLYLLAMMAKKQGVSDEEINNVLNMASK